MTWHLSFCLSGPTGKRGRRKEQRTSEEKSRGKEIGRKKSKISDEKKEIQRNAVSWKRIVFGARIVFRTSVISWTRRVSETECGGFDLLLLLSQSNRSCRKELYDLRTTGEKIVNNGDNQRMVKTKKPNGYISEGFCNRMDQTQIRYWNALMKQTFCFINRQKWCNLWKICTVLKHFWHTKKKTRQRTDTMYVSD